MICTDRVGPERTTHGRRAHRRSLVATNLMRDVSMRESGASFMAPALRRLVGQRTGITRSVDVEHTSSTIPAVSCSHRNLACNLHEGFTTGWAQQPETPNATLIDPVEGRRRT
jgi:hypothetical protein